MSAGATCRTWPLPPSRPSLLGVGACGSCGRPAALPSLVRCPCHGPGECRNGTLHLRRPRLCDGSFILRSFESRCSGPESRKPGLTWPLVRLLRQSSTRSATLMGFSRSFAVLLRPRRSTDHRPHSNPPAVSAPITRIVLFRGAAGAFHISGSRCGNDPRDAATGFSRRPAVPHRRIGEAATALDFVPLPGIRTPGLRLIGGTGIGVASRPACPLVCRSWPGIRHVASKAIRSWAWTRLPRARPSAFCRADA